MVGPLIRNRRTLWYLAMQQVSERYLGTWGGALWVVLHPMLLLLVFWIVFAKGFKLEGAGGQSFVLVLFCGLIPWSTFAEAVSGSVNAITGRAYLIKKIAFPVEILPVTHVVAALVTHAVMLLVLIGMLAWYHVRPGTGLALYPYYLLALCCFAAGLSWLLAAANVFYRDVSQVVVVLINVWFWATPIVWPPEMLPASFAPFLAFNPMNYVISGFKDAFLKPEPVLPALQPTLFFWTLTIGLWLLGSRVFRRLSPSFVDVL